MSARNTQAGAAVVTALLITALGVLLVSGGNVPHSKVEYGRMYQVPFAERIRSEAMIPVMAVGGIQGIDHVNTIVAAGRADLCAVARAELTDPYMVLRAANERGVAGHAWPPQYLAGRS